MHEFVSFNGIAINANRASISALSAGALYGRGIFTTIPIYRGEPFLWEKHWRRLETSAARLNIDLTEFSEQRTREAFDEITQVNRATEGRARITIFDESAGSRWEFAASQKTSLLILTADRPPPAAEDFRLTISAQPLDSRSSLAGIKSCNYLEKLIALEEVRSGSHHEAIQLNEREEVTSAVMANVFWLKRGQLYTPSLKTGCLPGTTREFVLENLECREVETGLDEFRSADAIFLTSAGIGVVMVSQSESTRFDQVDHPILHLLL